MLQANIRKEALLNSYLSDKVKCQDVQKGFMKIYESYCEGTQITKIDKMGDGFVLLLIVDRQTPFLLS